MPSGIAAYGEAFLLDAADAVGWWLQLHTGSPGEDGTANVAAETRRMQASFTRSGNTLTSDADVIFDALAATEIITAISLWTDEVGGDCLWWGDLAEPVQAVATATLVFDTGKITITLN